jgi:YfiH family protein
MQANWRVSDRVLTLITTTKFTSQLPGYSLDNFKYFNLALHVGDNKSHVLANRNLLNKLLPSEPVWLNQNHTNQVLYIDHDTNNDSYDAAYTHTPNVVCAVLTADCVPILLTDVDASFVCAIHAGWRGISSDIIKHTLIKINVSTSNVIAFIGPFICKSCYVVSSEFNGVDKSCLSIVNGVWHCDLGLAVRKQLLANGVLNKRIYSANLCTNCSDGFYSYRRNNVGGQTGRFASLIWLT